MLLAITVAYLLFPVDAVGWVCCLGVGLLIPQVRELDEGYLREGCRWVARYSYGVYLSHAVLIWLAFDELATWPVVARWCLFAVTTVVVPVALYHAIEAPLIALGRRLVRWRFQRRPLATARGRPSPRAEFLRARREAKVLFGDRAP
jgi:peptidoglycan/LPS O-acetylase OafA/YrhL